MTAHPQHPEGNAIAERMIQTLMGRISKVGNAPGTDWDDILPEAVFAINTAVSKTLKTSPYKLVHLRDPILPGEPLIATWLDEKPLAQEQRVVKYRSLARQNLVKAQQANNNRLNAHCQQNSFNVGDTVVFKGKKPVKKKSKSLTANKLGHTYQIKQKIDDNNFILEQISGTGVGTTKSVYASQIESFKLLPEGILQHLGKV